MIINKDIEDILKQLPGTSFGQALTKVLEQWKVENNQVKNIKSYEEVLGRQIAEKLVDDLFKFMEDKKSEVKTKNQYV